MLTIAALYFLFCLSTVPIGMIAIRRYKEGTMGKGSAISLSAANFLPATIALATTVALCIGGRVFQIHMVAYTIAFWLACMDWISFLIGNAMATKGWTHSFWTKPFENVHPSVLDSLLTKVLEILPELESQAKNEIVRLLRTAVSMSDSDNDDALLQLRLIVTPLGLRISQADLVLDWREPIITARNITLESLNIAMISIHETIMYCVNSPATIVVNLARVTLNEEYIAMLGHPEFIKSLGAPAPQSAAH